MSPITLKTFVAGLLLASVASSAVAQTKLPSGPMPDGMTYREWMSEIRRKDAQRIVDERSARPWDIKPGFFKKGESSIFTKD